MNEDIIKPTKATFEKNPGSNTVSPIETVLPIDGSIATQVADLNKELFEARGIDQKKLAELLIILWYRVMLAEMPDILEADPALSAVEVRGKLDKQGESSHWKMSGFGDWKFPPDVFEGWVENVRQAAVTIIDSRTNLLATPQKIAEANIPDSEKLKLLGIEGFTPVNEQNLQVLLSVLKNGAKASVMNYQYGMPTVARHRTLQLSEDGRAWVFHLDNLKVLSFIDDKGKLGDIGKSGWLIRVEREGELI